MFKYRTRGEWFEITTTQVDVICAMINEFVELEDEEYVPEEVEEDVEVDVDSKDNIISDEESDTEEKVEKPKKNKPYVCKKCNKGFKKRHHLDNHNRRKTPCDVKHECQKCHKVFISKTSLKRHEDRVTSCTIEKVQKVNIDNIYKCYMCNKEFTTVSNLRRHEKEVCSTVSTQTLHEMALRVSQLESKLAEQKDCL